MKTFLKHKIDYDFQTVCLGSDFPLKAGCLPVRDVMYMRLCLFTRYSSRTVRGSGFCRLFNSIFLCPQRRITEAAYFFS